MERSHIDTRPKHNGLQVFCRIRAFLIKYDGFRALAYIEAGACRLVSRKRTQYRSFPQLFRIHSGGDTRTSCPGR